MTQIPLRQAFETVIEKKLTEYVLTNYYVWNTEYVCSNCNKTMGNQLSPDIHAKFTHIKTGKTKTLNLAQMSQAFNNYYGPETPLPKAPLVTHKVLRDMPWCSKCCGDTFGQDPAVSPALPTVTTREVPVEIMEQERKRKGKGKSKSRSIHTKKPTKKPTQALSDADFFGAITETSK